MQCSLLVIPVLLYPLILISLLSNLQLKLPKMKPYKKKKKGDYNILMFTKVSFKCFVE